MCGVWGSAPELCEVQDERRNSTFQTHLGKRERPLVRFKPLLEPRRESLFERARTARRLAPARTRWLGVAPVARAIRSGVTVIDASCSGD
jgi:hypothetical protein